MNLNPRKLINPVGRKAKRYQEIITLLDLKPTDRILNVGSGKGYTFETFNKENPIIGIDIFKPENNTIKQKNFTYQQRTTDTLPYKDKEFDAVVCIGVLEHVQPEDAFIKTCQEIQRVGKKYLVLIPDKWTIIEPHYSFPFFHLLPVSIQKKIQEIFNLRYIEDGQNENEYEQIRYLSRKQWKELFPNAQTKVYWHIGPLIKNFIIWGK
jgi:ubiquinone/menaquinone biosynthesis C-methylase UbiE